LKSELPQEKTICSNCNNSKLLIDHNTGELVCHKCGLVISSSQLNRGPEWRAFDHIDREKLPRIGAPLSWALHDKGLSTTIGWANRDGKGRLLNSENRARLYRLRKWHRRSKLSESKHRNLTYALSEISKICNKLNLPRNVIETSSIIYRAVLNKNLIRGRTIKSVVVASIYIACRQCGIIRTLKDVAIAANITKKEAARNYRFLFRLLKPNVPPVNKSRYISRIVNKLKLSGGTERVAEKILVRAVEEKFTGGRGPGGMAAACTYISCQLTGESRTQGEIAIAAQVTEVTIRNRYKELVQNLEFNLLL
jgi:transcription initiation factor TFIIB